MDYFLNEIFDMRSTRLNLDGKKKETVLAELIDGIADLYPGCDRVCMLEAIRKREEKMSTGIGNGVALPHACCSGIENMAGAIGISKQGIDFNALDNKPVYVIFLLTASEQSPEKHIRVLTQIFKLAQSETFPLIKNAENVQEINTILSQIHLV